MVQNHFFRSEWPETSHDITTTATTTTLVPEMELEAMIFETILGFFHKHHYRLGADASGNAHWNQHTSLVHSTSIESCTWYSCTCKAWNKQAGSSSCWPGDWVLFHSLSLLPLVILTKWKQARHTSLKGGSEITTWPYLATTILFQTRILGMGNQRFKRFCQPFDMRFRTSDTAPFINAESFSTGTRFGQRAKGPKCCDSNRVYQWNSVSRLSVWVGPFHWGWRARLSGTIHQLTLWSLYPASSGISHGYISHLDVSPNNVDVMKANEPGNSLQAFPSEKFQRHVEWATWGKTTASAAQNGLTFRWICHWRSNVSIVCRGAKCTIVAVSEEGWIFCNLS